jgi:arylsulfatase A-like enzyme
VWHTNAGCSLLNQEEETIANIFSNQGYQTAMFGKWHLGDNYSV